MTDKNPAALHCQHCPCAEEDHYPDDRPCCPGITAPAASEAVRDLTARARKYLRVTMMDTTYADWQGLMDALAAVEREIGGAE